MDDQSSQITVSTSTSTIRAASLHGAPSGGSISVTVPRETELEEGEDDDEDDPLKVKELSLAFDYLMFKIQDQASQLSERVEAHVLRSKTEHEHDIQTIQDKLVQIKQLVGHCDQINLEIDKLEQLNMITKDFTQRLIAVQNRMNAHAQKFK
ncbi:hypothetical protein KL912_004843 [Ogataea haglerorum]|nr:hypothetical protein KL912_004843 [Ogataea haglerorum]KAG7755045.1 hypothetical protein KL947_004539 [Ogataea haglerorum]